MHSFRETSFPLFLKKVQQLDVEAKFYLNFFATVFGISNLVLPLGKKERVKMIVKVDCEAFITSTISINPFHSQAVWPAKNCQMSTYKSCPNMISLEKWMILTPLQKLLYNVGDLGKIIVATSFEWLPKVQKITQSGHTALTRRGRKMGTNLQLDEIGGKLSQKSDSALAVPRTATNYNYDVTTDMVKSLNRSRHLAVEPNLAKFCQFAKFKHSECLFSIWQNIEHTLVNVICYWANFQCWKIF